MTRAVQGIHHYAGMTYNQKLARRDALAKVCKETPGSDHAILAQMELDYYWSDPRQPDPTEGDGCAFDGGGE